MRLALTSPDWNAGLPEWRSWLDWLRAQPDDLAAKAYHIGDAEAQIALLERQAQKSPASAA